VKSEAQVQHNATEVLANWCGHQPFASDRI